MTPLPFSMALMEFLAEHREPLLTKFFLFMTFLGEVNGYILIVTLIYVMFDKSLGVRLAVMLLLTMTLNHVLKILIKNPRPFIREGTYLQKWAVPADYAKELATEYSTPSGHAMAAASFYGYLYACVRNWYVRAIAVFAIVFIGLSRPYLGVHYLEDILIGWPIGLLVAAIAVRYGDGIAAAWNRRSYGVRIAVTVAASALLWCATIAINGWQIDGEPRAYLGYAGFLTGIVIGGQLELRLVNFDPRSSNIAAKIARYIISVGMVILTLELLGKVNAIMADNFSLAGYALQYVRYTTAGVVSIFVAPLVFTSIGLARKLARD
ncbi:MAG: phosphatase PAP2 family protein [Rhizomicrobium sp.]|jgi:membrane-associated phospholipid phosphatase